MLFLLFFAFSHLEILEARSYPVDFGSTNTAPRLRVNSNGEIWVVAYWEGWIKRFDALCRPQLYIPPENDVPGGTFSLLDILDLNNGKLWLLSHSNPKIFELDRETGKYLKTHKMGGIGMLAWENGVLLGLAKHPDGPGDFPFIKVDKLGNLQNSWPVDTDTMLAKSTGMIELMAVQNDRFFWSTGLVPEIEIVTPGKPQRNWKLSVPLGFVPPPKKGFNLNYRFDRNKVRAYYDSFTQITEMHAIAGYGLAVCWMKAEQPFLLDIFDYRTGKRYFKTIKVPGRLFGVVGNRLYFYEDNIHFDTGLPLENEDVKIHIWSVNLSGMAHAT